jgi:uncharacterized protein
MSPEQFVAEGTAPALPALSSWECRVLGVLVEKAKTTPDIYPLSINALVSGCNQKSNRDPILNLTDLDVESTLADLQKKGLAIKITGGRVIRWRHALYEAIHVDKVELAILAELLLRGPQTEGELRSRASRMEAIDDLDILRTALQPMVERRLVIYLTPPERRGTVLTHGLYPAEELERVRAAVGKESAPAGPEPSTTRQAQALTPGWETRLSQVQSEISRLNARIEEMVGTVNNLARRFDAMHAMLEGRKVQAAD